MREKRKIIRKVLKQKVYGVFLICTMLFITLICKSIFPILLALFFFPVLFFTREEMEWICEWESELKKQYRRYGRKERAVIRHCIRKGEELWQQKKKN